MRFGEIKFSLSSIAVALCVISAASGAILMLILESLVPLIAGFLMAVTCCFPSRSRINGKRLRY